MNYQLKFDEEKGCIVGHIIFKDELLEIMNGISIKNPTDRIEAIEEVIADVGGGNLIARIPVDLENPDRLTALEIGINLVISDLEDETSERLKHAEELAKIKNVTGRK